MFEVIKEKEKSSNFVIFTNSLGDVILWAAMQYEDFDASNIELILNYASPKSAHPFYFIDPKISNLYKFNEKYMNIR